MFNENRAVQVVEGNTRPQVFIDITEADPLYPTDRTKDVPVDLTSATRHVYMLYRERSDQPTNSKPTLWRVELVKDVSVLNRAVFTPSTNSACPWLPAGITTEIPEFEAEIYYRDTATTIEDRLLKVIVFSVRRKFPDP